MAFAVKELISGKGEIDPDASEDVRAAAAACSGNNVCSEKAKEIVAKWEGALAANPELAQYAQSAGGIKKLGDGPLLAAAIANGFPDIHAFKRAMGVGGRSNVGIDRQGNLYDMSVKKGRLPLPLDWTASGN